MFGRDLLLIKGIPMIINIEQGYTSATMVGSGDTRQWLNACSKKQEKQPKINHKNFVFFFSLHISIIWDKIWAPIKIRCLGIPEVVEKQRAERRKKIEEVKSQC